jgi:hypothetical protein
MKHGFTMKALEDIPEGAEVFINHGEISNFNLLLIYGVTYPENDPDIQLSLKLSPSHPRYDTQLRELFQDWQQ